jgi:hypothetical protein
MIRILTFLALTTLSALAAGPDDKFDLSVTGVELKGNTLEVTVKITNQSAAAVKIDFAAEALVFKQDKELPSAMAQSIDTRPDIYKPRILLLVPPGASTFFTSKTSRLFSPNILAPGASLELKKSVSVTPTSFLRDAAKTPYAVCLNLAYRTAGNSDCQSTVLSPVYQITVNAQGQPEVSPRPATTAAP